LEHISVLLLLLLLLLLLCPEIWRQQSRDMAQILTKAPITIVLDPNGKLTITLTYGKVLQIVNTAVMQHIS
jgi:hypothetical protein